MSDWNWEKTGDKCPKCHADLLFADDPESETWSATGVYKCSKRDFSCDQATWDGMDGGDWEFDDDEFDEDEFDDDDWDFGDSDAFDDGDFG